MPLLSVRDLKTHFVTPRGVLRAVDGVTLDLSAGETVGLVGESGCGKSTLGKSILRLVPTTSGRVVFDGADIAASSGGTLTAVRRRMQMIFQDPFGSLNPRHTVGDILATPLKVHGLASRAERRARVADILAEVGLPADAMHRYPHEFSGGQRQRIGIARALVLKPALVVCDEPVSALDLSVQAQILNLLTGLKQRFALSYLFISHDLSIVRWFADRVLVMYLGCVVEEGSPAALWDRPLHPYTRALMDAAPDPSRRRHAAPLAGDLPSPEALPAGCRFHPRCPFASERCRVEVPALRDFPDGQRVACHHAEELLPREGEVLAKG